MKYKTTDGLMRHLRNNGIRINGSKQKQQLINTGYYHGYKGYRFFKRSNKKLPFVAYEEIYATIQYDSKLKELIYAKIMFIETAIKNIALECILKTACSGNLQDFYTKAITSYANAPRYASLKERKKYQQNKLMLQDNIHRIIAKNYKKGNPIVTHFYDNIKYNSIPLWALFEILMLGDFGNLLSCLTFNTRDAITKEIGFNLSCDTNRELIYRYIFTLKDLRNAVAHNDIVFDARFNKSNPSKAMQSCIINDVGVPYINFETIGDYIILIAYYLKLLKVTKTEIKALIREFNKITSEYSKNVNSNVVKIVIHPDLTKRMQTLENFI